MFTRERTEEKERLRTKSALVEKRTDKKTFLLQRVILEIIMLLLAHQNLRELQIQFAELQALAMSFVSI